MFKGLRSVDVDPWSGDVYLADAFNNRIRRLQDTAPLELESDRAYDNGGNGFHDREQKTAAAVLDDLQYWNSPGTEHQTRRRRLPTASGSAATAAAVPASALPLAHDAVAVSPPLILIWVGQCGVYHDHLYNGQVLTEWLNTGNGTARVSTHGAKAVPRWEARLERNTSVFKRLDELKVKAIVFYSDAGVMSPSEESALVDWARRGGGVVGLHTAIATFAYAGPDTNGFVSLNPSYHEMLNGIFNGHSGQLNPLHWSFVFSCGSCHSHWRKRRIRWCRYMDFTLNVVDPDDPVTAGVHHFMVTGELYFPKTNLTRSKLLLTAYDVEHDQIYPSE